MNYSSRKRTVGAAALFMGSILLLGAATVSVALAATPTELMVPLSDQPGATQSVTGIADYIKLIYTFGTGFGIIVFRGIQYTVSELIPSKEEALSGIKAALLGLLLLLGANVILYYLNPALLSLQEPDLVTPFNPAGGSAPVVSPSGGLVTNLTASVAGGKKVLTWTYTPPPDNPTFDIDHRTAAFIGKPEDENWNHLTGNLTTTSYELPSYYQIPGALAEFRARSSIGGVAGPWSNSFIFINAPPSSQPTLAKSESGSTVTLTWGYAPGPGETTNSVLLYAGNGKKKNAQWDIKWMGWKQSIYKSSDGSKFGFGGVSDTSITFEKGDMQSAAGSNVIAVRFKVEVTIIAETGTPYTQYSPEVVVQLVTPPALAPENLSFDAGTKTLSWVYNGGPLTAFQVEVSPSTLNPPPATSWQVASGGNVAFPATTYAAADPALFGNTWWMRVVPVGSDGVKFDKASVPLLVVIPPP